MQCTGHCFTDSTDSCLYSADASESFWFSDVHRDQWEHGTGNPDGSLVYVRYEEPDTIVKDDVIAFYSNNADGSIITHRVVSNSPAMGQFITKGDANEEKDMNPIPYNNYIGKVKLSVPVVGGIAQAATGTAGKIAAASMIGLAVILEIVAAMLDRRDDGDE